MILRLHVKPNGSCCWSLSRWPYNARVGFERDESIRVTIARLEVTIPGWDVLFMVFRRGRVEFQGVVYVITYGS